MSLVEIATQPWGVVQDRAGNVKPNRAFELTTTGGGAVTRYTDEDGVTPETSTTTNADGIIPGFVEAGTYLVTVGSTVRRVEAISGSTVRFNTTQAVTYSNGLTGAAGLRALEVEPDGDLLMGANTLLNATSSRSIPDFHWDAAALRLKTRSLMLTEMNDPVDLATQRAMSALTHLSAGVTLPVTSLPVDFTEGFPTSGQVVLGSGPTAILAYTSITATTLEGVTVVSGSGTFALGAQVESRGYPYGIPTGVPSGVPCGTHYWRAFVTPAGGTPRRTPGGSFQGRMAGIYARTTEDQFDGATGGKLVIQTTPNGTGSPVDRIEIGQDGSVRVSATDGGGFLSLGEQSVAPGVAEANRGRLYLIDNGAGKTRLMVQFATGAAQQVAIEP